uniref:Cyanobacterial aminoacyl-tRNA synthetase CAAD domain-containing protein n=1 Tax=Arundo donax TaxID=35708 RepID=A0A0A9D1X1_ARUDO
MVTACRFAAPLGLAPLPRTRAGAVAVAVAQCGSKTPKGVAVRATSGGEGTAETPEIVKAAQDAWDKVEDKYAVATIGVAAIVALWTAVGAIKAIDKLPILPGVLELVGIGYTGVSLEAFRHVHVHLVPCYVLSTSLMNNYNCYFVFMQWFTYRNLIFQPDREALISKIKSTYNEITGSSS